MKDKMIQVLVLLYVIFIGLFAFDTPIFSLGFLIHQIPCLMVLIVFLISLKIPKLGGILYLILFLGFTLFFKTYSQIFSFLLISLPLLIFGIVFLKKRKRK